MSHSPDIVGQGSRKIMSRYGAMVKILLSDTLSCTTSSSSYECVCFNNVWMNYANDNLEQKVEFDKGGNVPDAGEGQNTDKIQCYVFERQMKKMPKWLYTLWPQETPADHSRLQYLWFEE